MTTERLEPSLTADERSMLDGWLDYHRQTLAWKCEGLTDAQLRTASVEPSELTLMGLVRHMAEVERYWFHEVLLDEDLGVLYSSEEDRDGDFHFSDSDSWEEAHTTWQAEMDRARRNTAGLGLNDLSKGTSRPGERFNLRWIYTHMIEEYARHNGHADLVRERIYGSTGD
ncbi:DinB family protein [Streptomyces sp. P17]|uniref:DinB family protein n=1 Tax=Streptomyces sp. P17 TaxID=3074716 RepID=UPI0028F454C5|nr:DinB family protein [Streptomyces sp. P17]MDT9700407.1 DinB family protein [Streptomyces sp. P17]